MDKGRTNIDLVFRNGLKDFEVLPPPGVWEGIAPVISRKPVPFIWLRVAAVAVVIVSSAFFLYRYTRELSDQNENRILALNVATPPVFYKNQVPGAPSFSEMRVEDTREPSVIPVSYRDEETASVPVEKISVPEFIVMPVNNRFNFTRTELLPGSFLPENTITDTKNFLVDQGNVLSLSDYGPVKPPARWSVAAMASPTYYSSFNAAADNGASRLSSTEQAIVSYTGGVALSYKISRRFSVQSGLYYSSLGQEVEGINSFAGFQSFVYSKGDHNFEVLTSNGTIFINNKDVFLTTGGNDQRVITSYSKDVFDPEKASLNYLNNTIQQNFSYLELPVILRYKLIDKAIDVNMTGGLSYNMLVGNSVFTVVDGTKYSFGETKGLNSFMVSSSLGMGMEYSFSEKLSINLEPTFRYYLNPFSGTSSSAIHPYSFGIFSGLSYKF